MWVALTSCWSTFLCFPSYTLSLNETSVETPSTCNAWFAVAYFGHESIVVASHLRGLLSPFP